MTLQLDKMLPIQTVRFLHVPKVPQDRRSNLVSPFNCKFYYFSHSHMYSVQAFWFCHHLGLCTQPTQWSILPPMRKFLLGFGGPYYIISKIKFIHIRLKFFFQLSLFSLLEPNFFHFLEFLITSEFFFHLCLPGARGVYAHIFFQSS